MSTHPWSWLLCAKAIPESPRSASSGGIATCLRAGRAARPFGKTMATPEDDAFGRPPGRGTGTKGATSGPRFHPRAGDAVSKLARRGLPRCQNTVRRVRNREGGSHGNLVLGSIFLPTQSPSSAPGRWRIHWRKRSSICASDSLGCSRFSVSRIIATPLSKSSRAMPSFSEGESELDSATPPFYLGP